MRRAYYVRKIEKTNRFLLVLIVAVTVIAVMMGGSFAWKDFTQAKTNKFRGFVDADVSLHDEFDGQNKDVFVENSGTSVIYVRIRLDEYIEIGGESLIPDADIKDKNSWIPHLYSKSSIVDCEQIKDGHLFHSYYKWDMSGAQRNYFEGTPGLVYSELVYSEEKDEEKVYIPTLEEGGRPTAVNAPPIKMTEYLKLRETVNLKKWKATTSGCWILDDTLDGGGWAYWSMPLAPGKATNLLLDSVTKVKDPSDDWFYGIDVKMQAVTVNDLSKWSENGWTVSLAAEELVEILKSAEVWNDAT